MKQKETISLQDINVFEGCLYVSLCLITKKHMPQLKYLYKSYIQKPKIEKTGMLIRFEKPEGIVFEKLIDVPDKKTKLNPLLITKNGQPISGHDK